MTDTAKLMKQLDLELVDLKVMTQQYGEERLVLFNKKINVFINV